jgi:hypothetical protein
MSRLLHSCSIVLTAALFVAGILLIESPADALAQGAGPNPVSIETVDGIKLKGLFYEGKKTSPTVIMLHPIGEGKSIKSPDWRNLAETLQKSGYSVMMFDFRGHGDSTEIKDVDAFRLQPINRALKLKEKDVIDVKDFINVNNYLPVLVNDIAAVKAYLDRKHDAGVCNTSNTMVIGAENGGVLGAIWINSEWYRYKLTPPAMMGKLPVVDKRAEGNDIIAAVFLSVTASLGPKRNVNVASILNTPAKVHGMAATFFYGDKDTKAKDYGKLLESKLRAKDKEGKVLRKHELTGVAAVKNTNLAGIKLLQKSLETDKAIVDWLDLVASDRSNEYTEREVATALYIWRNPTVAVVNPTMLQKSDISAKKTKGDKNLHFSTYELFTPQ